MTVRNGVIHYVIEPSTLPEERAFGAYVAITALPVFGIRPVIGGGDTEAAARENVIQRAAERGVQIVEVTGETT